MQLQARVLLLPNLNVGTNLHEHTGNIQRSSGSILNVNQSSLYFGGGAGAIGTRTVQIPAVSVFSPLTEALFEPMAARQRVETARFDASNTANTILLEVAGLHFESLAAEADLRARHQAIRQAEEVVRLTRAYAEAGEGREADAERSAERIQFARAGRATCGGRSRRRGGAVVAPASPRPGRAGATRARSGNGHAHQSLGAATRFDSGRAGASSFDQRGRRGRRGGGSATQAGAVSAALADALAGLHAGAFGGGSNLFPPELSHFAESFRFRRSGLLDAPQFRHGQPRSRSNGRPRSGKP